MKKLFLIGIVLMLTFLVAACGKADISDSSEGSQTAGTTDTSAPNSSSGEAPAETTPSPSYKTVQNPIAPSGNDPWIVEQDGQYYYCFSQNNGVAVAKLPSLDKIPGNNAVQVYSAPEGTMYSKEYWAPELHYIDGEWYIYVAADDGANENHRMYVLKGSSQDPTDPFTMVGKITDPSDKWAIDGTVLQWNGELYFVWSGWEGDTNVAQNLYIAHMSDPCTIDSERVLLSSPAFGWEKIGTPYVNEGPAALLHDGKVFLVYSASGSWTDNYCLGMLTLTGDDPMKAESWTKSTRPVFSMRAGVAYGPGHCSFAPAPDGSIFMIYHANLSKGTGWSGRSVWLQPIAWDEEGNPDFGRPSKEILFPRS